MKKELTKTLFTLLGLLCIGVMHAQDITVDVASLTAPESKAGKTDFSKSFKLLLKSNEARPNLKLSITDDEGAPEQIVNGLKKGDNIIQFNSIEEGRKLSVAKQGGGALLISETSTIQIVLGDKSFTITNSAGDGNAGSGKRVVTRSTDPVLVGIELHDAVQAKIYFSSNDDKLYELLGKIARLENFDSTSVVKKFEKNPFIAPVLSRMKKVETKGGSAQGIFDGVVKKALNTDVTTVADGIARFLVKRTKEELTVAFFQHFKDLINQDKYKDAQILFAETMQTLNAIDQEIYLFENYITSLREAFEKDLSLLLKNMPVVIQEGTFREYFNAPQRQSLKHSLLLGFFAADELTNGTHPGKVIENLPNEHIDSINDQNAAGSIHTVQMLSASLRSRGSDSYWTSLDSIQMLLTKDDTGLIAAKFYLGFLYEKSATIRFDTTTLKESLDFIAKSLPEIEKYIVFVKSLGRKCHDVEANIRQIKLKQPETASIDLFHRLFRSFADVVEHINTVLELPHIKQNGKITAAVASYLSLFRECNDLALNTVRKNYGLAIVNTYNIYLKATGKKEHVGQKDVVANTALVIPGDKSKEPVQNANNSVTKTSEFIKKYGNFMASVVKANSSQEVAQAIETAALPVGSATIKRHSNWNVSLNAYVGLFLGSEKINGVDDGFEPNLYGVTAPIGIAISKGVNWEKKYGWSFSLFFSILDLGAPVAFRFKDEKTEKIPSIQLKDIVSPGIFASFGLPSVPVSLNFGWQSGPVLREITPQLADKASANYNRWSLSVAVDIPVLNFLTRRDEK
jgi:hypothetical protein